MSVVRLTIDDQRVEAPAGTRLLWAALEAGIFIPHLCAHRELDHHPGSCRLCWVEIEGRPVTACTEPVREGMVVRTRSEAVDRLVRTGFELIMSTHRLNCGECPANKKCALQQISRERKLPLKPKRFPKVEPDLPIDDSHPRLGLDPNHCVLCGRCVHACERAGAGRVLDFINRGLATVVGTFDGQPLGDHDCGACEGCFTVCPVGALYVKQGSGG